MNTLRSDLVTSAVGSNLHYQCDGSGNEVRVKVTGCLGLLDAQELVEQTLTRVSGRTSKIVIDLADCTDVDSSGEAALDTLCQICRRDDVRLVIRAPASGNSYQPDYPVAGAAGT